MVVGLSLYEFPQLPRGDRGLEVQGLQLTLFQTHLTVCAS